MTTKQKQLNRILAKMGGRLNGHNIDNYKRIARITKSSVSTVKSWLRDRNIPDIKMAVIKKELE